MEEFEEASDPLDTFYADLGCNYHFYYNRIDFNSLKYLAKLIVGDYSLPPKSSVELFGEAINYINIDKDVTAVEPASFMKKGEKKEKPKEKKMKPKTGQATEKEMQIEKQEDINPNMKAGISITFHKNSRIHSSKTKMSFSF